jgi:hypothetical protein
MRLREQRDVRGLIAALRYSSSRNKAQRINNDAADCLAAYPYTAVVEILMDVGTSQSPAAARALNAVCRMLYPYHQKKSELIDWWKSGPVARDELSELFNKVRLSNRNDQWRAIETRIKSQIKAPAHIETLIQTSLYNSDELSEAEQHEARKWIDDRDVKVAAELKEARRQLETKWAADDIAWAEEEEALEKESFLN